MKPNYRLIESLLNEAPPPMSQAGGAPSPSMPSPQQGVPQPAMGGQEINMLISQFETALKSGDFQASERIKSQIQAIVQQMGVR